MGRAFEFRKARKLKRWSNMAKTFTRIGREIVITVKEGGKISCSFRHKFKWANRLGRYYCLYGSGYQHRWTSNSIY